MKLTVTQGVGHIRASPTESRLDAASAQMFKNALIDLVNQGESRIILDLSPLDFMDSSGLGAIVSVSRALRKGGALAICSVPPRLQPIFKLTRLGTVIPIHPDLPTAEAAFRLG